MTRYFCWAEGKDTYDVAGFYVWADDYTSATEFAKGIFLLKDVPLVDAKAIKSCNQQKTRRFEHDIRADQTKPLPLPKEVTDDD